MVLQGGVCELKLPRVRELENRQLIGSDRATTLSKLQLMEDGLMI